MERHGYNIFPEMNAEDYSRLLLDIKVNGYDRSQKIKNNSFTPKDLLTLKSLGFKG